MQLKSGKVGQTTQKESIRGRSPLDDSEMTPDWTVFSSIRHIFEYGKEYALKSFVGINNILPKDRRGCERARLPSLVAEVRRR